jgi:hypothetical protein
VNLRRNIERFAMVLGAAIVLVGLHTPAKRVPPEAVALVGDRHVSLHDVVDRGRALRDRGLSVSAEALLEQTILDEVLFQRAGALGLVQPDPVVRARVVGNIREYVTRKTEQHPPGEAELQRYYERHLRLFHGGERYRLSEIFLARRADRDARAQLEAVRDRLKAEASWTLAAAQGDPPPHALGSQLLVLDVLNARYGHACGRAVDAAQVGQLTSIVETPFGFHLFRVDERAPGLPLPFEEVRERVRIRAMRDATHQGYDDLLQAAHASARIWKAPDAIERLTAAVRRLGAK